MTLDLKDDPLLIEKYVSYHRRGAFDSEVSRGLLAVGVRDMEILVVENRLFMILDVDDDFSFDRKRDYDNQNPEVREWEALMWSFQAPIRNSRPGEKWRTMTSIFSLSKYLGDDDICVMAQ